MDRESDAKQRGHRRHRRRHRRVLSEDAGAAEHDPNLGRAKTASGQMAEGGVQQPSAVPPTAASDTAPPSSMLTSNSLRLSSTAPFSGAPPGRILAAAGKHAGKYAWRKRKICQRDGPETPETPPRSAAGTPALSARSRRRICSPERKRSQPPDGNLRVARLSLPLRGRRRFCRWPGGPPAPQLHPPSRRASSSCSTKSCLGAAQRRLRDSPAAPRGSTRGV